MSSSINTKYFRVDLIIIEENGTIKMTVDVYRKSESYTEEKPAYIFLDLEINAIKQINLPFRKTLTYGDGFEENHIVFSANILYFESDKDAEDYIKTLRMRLAELDLHVEKLERQVFDLNKLLK